MIARVIVRQDVIGRRGQSEHVRARHRLALVLLRRRIAVGAVDACLPAVARLGSGGDLDPRRAKVDQPGDAELALQDQVRGLDVLVHHRAGLRVEVLQDAHHLDHGAHDLLLGQPSRRTHHTAAIVGVRHEHLEVFPLDVFHDDVKAAVLGEKGINPGHTRV